MKRSRTKSSSQSRLRQNPAKRTKSSIPGRKPKIGRYIIGIAVLAAVTGLAAREGLKMIKSDPIFTVRNVIVQGAEHINPGLVTETADIEEGANIFDVDLKNVSMTLKRRFVAEEFIVTRKLPGTIIIKIRERKPVALLNTGALVGIDRNGIPLPHIDATFVEELPIITGIRNIKSLDDPEVRKKLLTGIRLLGRIHENAPGVYSRISELNVSSVSEMGFTLLDTGIEVLVGTTDWERKLPNLEKTISAAISQMEAVKTIDIRFREKVILRRAEGAK